MTIIDFVFCSDGTIGGIGDSSTLGCLAFLAEAKASQGISDFKGIEGVIGLTRVDVEVRNVMLMRGVI